MSTLGRIRTIKPEFPQSESMGRISRDARLLFIQLWTIADDEGRTRAAGKMLASLLFPYDKDAPKLIESWLVELEGEKCITRYEVDGSKYLEILFWGKHQKIDRPSPSRLPSRILASPREPSTTDQDLGPGPRTKDQKPHLLEIPIWLDLDAWAAFLEMRRRIGKPATPRAMELLVEKLKDMEDRGINSTRVLETSTMNCWQGVFEPKEEKRGFTNQDRGNQRVAAQLEELRKAGVSFPAGVPEDGVSQGSPVAGGGHGRPEAGVVLEGSG